RLLNCPDVPVRFYAKAWGKPIAEEQVPASEPPADVTAGAGVPKVERTTRPQRTSRAKLKSEQTRTRNRQRKREDLNKTLAPEDIRAQGLKSVLLAGLDAMQADLEKGKS